MFKNPFKKTLPPCTVNMEVLMIEHEADRFDVALGITPDCLQQLIEATKRAIDASDDPAEQAVYVSKVAKHPNELFLMGFMLGCWREQQNNPMARLFGSLSGL